MPLAKPASKKESPASAAKTSNAAKLREVHELMHDQIKDRESIKYIAMASKVRGKELVKLLGELAIDTEEFAGIRATRFPRTTKKLDPKKLLKKGVKLNVIEACTTEKTSFTVKISRIGEGDEGENESQEDED